MKEILKVNETVKKFLSVQKIKAADDYKRSQFVYFYERGNKQYIFNTLTRQCFLTEESLPNKVTADEIEKDEALTKLMQGYFLVPEDKDECRDYLSLFRIIRAFETRNNGYTLYTILPTLACNARCVYCYEEGRKQITMSDETVSNTIAYIMATRDISKKIRLAWFGGEPLMCVSIIDRICRELRERGVDFYSTMISNGSYITEELAEKMVSEWKLKHIQISMDCSEDEYIKRKNYYTYKNYYRTIPQNVNHLIDRGVSVTVRCNVDKKNADFMPEFISDMSEMIHDKRRVDICFAPLDQSRVLDSALPVWRKIENALGLARDAGFIADTTVVLTHFKRNNCIADDLNESIIISADGKLYKCDYCMPGTECGDVVSGITRPDMVNVFLNGHNLREKCADCVFLPECTPFSGCPIKEPNCKAMGETMMNMALRNLLDRIRPKTLQEAQNETKG